MKGLIAFVLLHGIGFLENFRKNFIQNKMKIKKNKKIIITNFHIRLVFAYEDLWVHLLAN